MAKFKTKPVFKDAWQWNETKTLLAELIEKGMFHSSFSGHQDQPDLCQNLRIVTLEGTMSVSPGDWIIRGLRGEFYPCKADIFADSYEPVEQEG